MRLLHSLLLGLLIGVASMASGPGPLAAQEDTVPDEPTLTVRLSPSDPYLQEEIVQVVRLIAPHPFEELVLDLPPVDGAEIVTLQQPKSRKFETYGGEGFIFETSRAIFPRQSGELRIPPVRVSGSIGISRNEKKAFALREDETFLKVKPPPASYSEDWWLVASDVMIQETWSKPLETLRVGDRVTRLIEVNVTGATGAHLPDLEQRRSNGLTILPGRIERRTETSARGVIGKISRSFDIRIESDQPLNLAPIRVVWWNTEDETEKRTVASAVRLEPLPRDVEKLVADAMTEAAYERDISQRGILAIVLGLGVALLALVFWLIGTGWQARPEDKQLRRDVLEDGRPINAIRALHRWKEVSYPNEPAVTLEKLGERLGPKAEDLLERLQRAAFGREDQLVDAATLALEVVEIAQQRRRQRTSEMIRRGLDSLLGKKLDLPAIDLRKNNNS
jgi:hypothetical protein